MTFYGEEIEEDARAEWFRPICSLFTEVLVRAILDCELDNEIGEDAREWLGTDSEEAYSFNWVCDLLEFDAEFVRNGIEDFLAGGKPLLFDEKRKLRGQG